jgi:alkaline phosphatase D
MNHRLFVSVLSVLAFSTSLCATGRIVAGPMLGYQEHREVLVWLETEGAGRVELSVRPAVADAPSRLVAATRSLTNPIGTQVHHFVVDGLVADQAYAYAVMLDGTAQPAATPLTFRAKSQWEWRGDPPVVRFLVGSCSYINDPPYDRPTGPNRPPYGASPEIFRNMAKHGGDFMLWLGDNLYLREQDWSSRYGIFYRYSADRRAEAVQPLLAAMHHYGTWDDHEFGPNDSSRSYELKDTTLEAFRWYWPMRSAGETDNPGIYTRFVQGDAEIFILDGRYHRDASALADATPGKSFLGPRQLAWLKSALSDSNANSNIALRFIAVGSQFLNPMAFDENLSRYPQERADILDFILKNKIGGVVFLTGDRHFGEFSRLERAGAPPVLELTSSSLTAGANRRPVTEGEKWAEAKNPVRVPGSIIVENNFGEITLTGPRRARILGFTAYSREGKSLWSTSVPVADLQFARAP